MCSLPFQAAPKVPKPPPMPTAPEPDVDIAARAARARERERARRGYQATILTSPSGLTTPPTTAPKQLLGS